MTDPEKKKEAIRMVKFVFFSISAGLIQVLSFTMLDLFTTWDYWPKYLIALTLSVLWNFTLNRSFTFQSANNVPIAMLKVAAFYAVFTPLSTIGGDKLTKDCGWNEFLVLLLTMACNFVTEYIYDRFVVFGKSIDTNERAGKAKKEEEHEQ
ncbi:MAG: GtrA family protein [Lachnospiraceae bacterium]|nr:GtrA family protein [Lachnospiraceae bacterium]